MIATLHEKHKIMCFLRSMGSTFSSFATPPQRNEYFLQNLHRGVPKVAKCDSHAACEAKQNVLLMKHEKYVFDFLLHLATENCILGRPSGQRAVLGHQGAVSSPLLAPGS